MSRLVKVSLLLTLFLQVGIANAAGPATKLIVNCIPEIIPPPSGPSTCFSKQVGVPFTFWVLAVDSDLKIVTDYAGAVHISSDDPTATLPPDHTFTNTDAGIAAFTMTFHSVTTSIVPSRQMVTAADNQNGLKLYFFFRYASGDRTVVKHHCGRSSSLSIGTPWRPRKSESKIAIPAEVPVVDRLQNSRESRPFAAVTEVRILLHRRMIEHTHSSPQRPA